MLPYRPKAWMLSFLALECHQHCGQLITPRLRFIPPSRCCIEWTVLGCIDDDLADIFIKEQLRQLCRIDLMLLLRSDVFGHGRWLRLFLEPAEHRAPQEVELVTMRASGAGNLPVGSMSH